MAQDEAVGHKRLSVLRALDLTLIDKGEQRCYYLIMKMKSTTRMITALVACLVLASAFFIVPYVHKHAATTQQVPLQDYDASCYFVKAEKISVRAPSQQVVACVVFLLFVTVMLPFVERRTEVNIPVRSLFTRNVQPPRAPPYC